MGETSRDDTPTNYAGTDHSVRARKGNVHACSKEKEKQAQKKMKMYGEVEMSGG